MFKNILINILFITSVSTNESPYECPYDSTYCDGITSFICWFIILLKFSFKTTLECGKTYTQNTNYKIYGGVEAEAHSWPSVAFIVLSYRTTFLGITNKSITTAFNFYYVGSLISSKAILTTANFIPQDVIITEDNANYLINVIPNEYYPTYESMFTAYLGVNDLTKLDDAVRIRVESITKVCKYIIWFF